jgi:putative transposase
MGRTAGCGRRVLARPSGSAGRVCRRLRRHRQGRPQAYANALRRRQPRPGDKWHLDEVFIKINGRLKKTRTVPRVIITDMLRSYGAAHREVMPSAEHRSHKGLNNRSRTVISPPGSANGR